jgi:hypothetical protein
MSTDLLFDEPYDDAQIEEKPRLRTTHVRSLRKDDGEPWTHAGMLCVELATRGKGIALERITRMNPTQLRMRLRRARAACAKPDFFALSEDQRARLLVACPEINPVRVDSVPETETEVVIEDPIVDVMEPVHELDNDEDKKPAAADIDEPAEVEVLVMKSDAEEVDERVAEDAPSTGPVPIDQWQRNGLLRKTLGLSVNVLGSRMRSGEGKWAHYQRRRAAEHEKEMHTQKFVVRVVGDPAPWAGQEPPEKPAQLPAPAPHESDVPRTEWQPMSSLALKVPCSYSVLYSRLRSKSDRWSHYERKRLPYTQGRLSGQQYMVRIVGSLEPWAGEDPPEKRTRQRPEPPKEITPVKKAAPIVDTPKPVTVSGAGDLDSFATLAQGLYLGALKRIEVLEQQVTGQAPARQVTTMLEILAMAEHRAEQLRAEERALSKIAALAVRPGADVDPDSVSLADFEVIEAQWEARLAQKDAQITELASRLEDMTG